MWQAESRLVREATVPMAAFLSHTTTLKAGSGVVNNWTRNPALLASTFSTLDDLAPGRVILGIGAWWDPLATKVGIDRSRPLRAMRETVEACRALLADETVTYDGEFVHLDGVELDYVHQERRPKDVPIYIGATGMQMMELTGAHRRRRPAELPGVARLQRPGPGAPRRRGARPQAGPSTTSTGPSSSCARSTTTARSALDAARLLVTQYLGQQPHIMKASGVPESLLEEIGRVLTWPATHDQVVEASRLVPDDIVQMICAVGHARRVPGEGGRVRRPRAARARSSTRSAPDVHAMIDVFAP